MSFSSRSHDFSLELLSEGAPPNVLQFANVNRDHFFFAEFYSQTIAADLAEYREWTIFSRSQAFTVASDDAGKLRIIREGVSLKSASVAESDAGTVSVTLTSAPTPRRFREEKQHSARATASPPSEQS